jgi:lysophospholipase L1-like esterase
MNERIRQLALEAFAPINAMASEGVADHHTFDQAWFQHYNQKFAELIVQECVNLLEFHGFDDAVSYIKCDFGAEE